MILKHNQQLKTLESTMFVNKRFLFVIIIIYILPLFINFCWVLGLHEYKSEFPEKAISVLLENYQIICLFFYNIVLFTFLIYIFFLLQRKRFVISKEMDIFFSRKRLEKFLYIIIIAKICFQLKTGVGRAGNDWSHTKFSVFFNIFNIDTLFLVYYLTYRPYKNKTFIFLVVIYSALQVLSGWTGFILSLVLMEIYCNINTKRVKKYIILLPLIFFIGALAYQFIYPLKLYIRFGIVENISYGEALIKLMERMSWFSHSCVSFQNSDRIRNLYFHYGYSGTEIKGFFKPVVPSFLMKNKDFRSLNNLLMNSVYPDLNGNTSANFGQLMYLYNLIRISVWDFVSYFIILFLNTFLYKLFMDMCSPNKNVKGSFSSNYIIFSYFISIFSVGALENISYGWLSIIWTYMFLFCVGIIKVSKK